MLGNRLEGRMILMDKSVTKVSQNLLGKPLEGLRQSQREAHSITRETEILVVFANPLTYGQPLHP